MRQISLRYACGLGLALVVIAGCEREEILAGERLSIRAPLSQDALAAEQETTEFAAFAAPQAQNPDEWPMRGFNAQNLRPPVALGAELTEIWSVPIGAGNSRRARLTADPIFAQGMILTLDAAAQVQATSPEGAVIWRADLTPDFEAEGGVSGGGVMASGARLYATTGYGELIALSASDGTVIWRQRLAAGLGTPLAAGGLVYVVSRDDRAFAIESDTGRIRWQVQGTGASAVMAAAPSPAVTDRLVLLPFSSGEISGLLRQSGVQVWSGSVAGARAGVAYNYINDVVASPVVSGGVIYSGNASGRVVALDTGSGDRIWTASEGAMSPLTVAGNAIFFVSDRNALIRLDRNSGAVVWSAELPLYQANRERRRKAVFTYTGPILADGRLWLTSGEGEFLAFDPETGAPLGERPLRGGAASNPIVVGGTLYLVTQDGNLRAYR